MMDTKHAFSISQRNWLLLGTTMVVVGCFLLWGIEGGFVGYRRYGIRLYPVFQDNGGITVLLFGIFIIGLIFRSGNFTKKPFPWILACSIALVTISIYHTTYWLLLTMAWDSNVEAPTIHFGLVTVGIGSLINLTTSLFMNFTRNKK